MAVNVRPLRSADIRVLSSGIVNSVAPFNMKRDLRNTVADPNLFGVLPEHRHTEKRYEDEFVRMGNIHLAMEVPNPFLVGSKGETFKVLLGRPDIEDIMYGKVAMSFTDHTIVPRDKCDSPYNEEDSDLVYGGLAIQTLLEDFDVHEAIDTELKKEFISKCLSREDKTFYKETGEVPGVIKRVDDAVKNGVPVPGWISDDYVFIPDPNGQYILPRLRQLVDDNMEDKYMSRNPRLTFLYRYRDEGAMYFIQMIMDDVLVLPLGYRETIDGRVDPLTAQYNQLVKYNNELRDALAYRGNTLKTILMKYERIVKSIVNIYCGLEELERTLPDSFSSLADGLSSKNGHIRDKMQGCRLDYSGRTVITCDKDMPLDHVGIPERMLPKLFEIEYAQHVRKTQNADNRNLAYLMDSKNTLKAIEECKKIAAEDFIEIGRQPTLHYLGTQAYKLVPVPGNSIVLSPLVVMPYNADFDGDQMHGEKPVTEEGKRELRQLLNSVNNYLYPRNGELTVVVRHEILYGLWLCSKIKDSPKSRTLSQEDVRQIGVKIGIENNGEDYISIVYNAVCKQEINIYDKINIKSGYHPSLYGKSAGLWAIKYALGKNNAKYAVGVIPLATYEDGAEDTELSDKWITKLLTEVTANFDRKDKFVSIIDKVVKLGFDVAEIWPPGITAINKIDVRQKIKDFNKDMEKRAELVAMGIEIESAFVNYFNEKFSELKTIVTDEVVDELGMDNGFVRMWKSGAKGNASNILQMFGMQGQIMKNDTEVFNTIIEHSLSDQLTGLEDFITAYGSRKGLADKTLETAGPGYFTRQLDFSGANMIVRTEDCGTTNGLLFTYDDLINFVDTTKISGHDEQDYKVVSDFLCKIIIGRYIAGTNEYIADETDAINAFNKYIGCIENGVFVKKNGLKMRSIVTCECPTCAKCYGKDLGSGHDVPKVGKPFGFVAAQTIGEPSTQLTMNQFHKGGVSSDEDLMSAYAVLEYYLHMTGFRDISKQNGVLMYDALSPYEGYVKEVYLGNGKKRIVLTEDEESDKNLLRGEYIVDATLRLKKYVKAGESFREVQGNLDPNEILKYWSYEDALRYMCLQTYMLYNAFTEVNFKYFETVIASMMYYIIARGTPEHRTGESLNIVEYYNLSNDEKSRIYGKWTLVGTKYSHFFERDFFNSLMFEDIKTSVRRHIVVRPDDAMTNPVTRLSFGLNMGAGTDIPGYLED